MCARYSRWWSSVRKDKHKVLNDGGRGEGRRVAEKANSVEEPSRLLNLRDCLGIPGVVQ
jgi:hypothetical protein